MRLKISNVQSSFVFIIPRQVICDSSIANIELTVKSVLDDLNNSTLFKISYGLKFSTAPPPSPLSVPLSIPNQREHTDERPLLLRKSFELHNHKHNHGSTEHKIVHVET